MSAGVDTTNKGDMSNTDDRLTYGEEIGLGARTTQGKLLFTYLSHKEHQAVLSPLKMRADDQNLAGASFALRFCLLLSTGKSILHYWKSGTKA